MNFEMPTKPYTIYYNDGSYLTYYLTDVDYKTITDVYAKSVKGQNMAAILSVGFMILNDIRSVILQRPQPENQGVEPEMSPEALEWIREQRRAEEIAAEEVDDDEDLDYKGGLV